MKALQIYLRIQLIILGLLSIYIFYHYQKQEPVTRLLVNSTWMVVSHKAGFCSNECFQNWQSSIQNSPQTFEAIKKMIRWLANSPKTAGFVLSQMDEGQKKQLIMLTTLSGTTPESIAQFEALYGISPVKLRDMLLKQNTR